MTWLISTAHTRSEDTTGIRRSTLPHAVLERQIPNHPDIHSLSDPRAREFYSKILSFPRDIPTQRFKSTHDLQTTIHPLQVMSVMAHRHKVQFHLQHLVPSELRWHGRKAKGVYKVLCFVLLYYKSISFTLLSLVRYLVRY